MRPRKCFKWEKEQGVDRTTEVSLMSETPLARGRRGICRDVVRCRHIGNCTPAVERVYGVMKITSASDICTRLGLLRRGNCVTEGVSTSETVTVLWKE